MRGILLLVLMLCGMAAGLPRALAAWPEPFTVPSAEAALPDISFRTSGGATETLADYRGRFVVLNLWATWCGPCVEEMPALDNLSKLLDPRHFAVLPVAVGRDDMRSVERFYGQNDVNFLPALVEHEKSLTRKLRPRGLPLTLIIGRQGQELARVYGAVVWDSPEMVAKLNALVSPPDTAHR